MEDGDANDLVDSTAASGRDAAGGADVRWQARPSGGRLRSAFHLLNLLALLAQTPAFGAGCYASHELPEPADAAAPTPDASLVSARSWLDEFHREACASQATCIIQTPFLWTDAYSDWCRSRIDDAWVLGMLVAGGLSFDDVAAAECLTWIATYGCMSPDIFDARWFFVERARDVPCGHVFIPGPRAAHLGDRCDPFPCELGLYCAETPYECPLRAATCQPQFASGTPCALATTHEGAYHQSSCLPGATGTRSRCDLGTGMCVLESAGSPGAAGSPCNGFPPCEHGLGCSDRSLCEPPLAEGAACDVAGRGCAVSGPPCQLGICTPGTECTPPPPTGAPRGAIGTCTAAPPLPSVEGAPCIDYCDPLAGVYCESLTGLCRRPDGTEGSWCGPNLESPPCDSPYHCALGYCSTEACQVDGDCVSGRCFGGTCRRCP